MIVHFERSKLIAALSPTTGCVGANAAYTSMEGILLEAKDGKCIISATDMEKGMRVICDCEVEEEGSYVLPASDFLQYTRIMPSGVLTLSVNDKLTASLKCGKICYMMRSLNGREYPAMPDLEGEWGFDIGQNVLKAIIGHTAHSVAQGDSNHPELCGGYLTINGNTLTMVTCDSFTLAKCVYTTTLSQELPSSLSFIIPGKSMAELTKLLSDDEEKTVTIKPAKKHIVFDFGEIVFFSRLIDMKYIDYERILRTELPIKVSIDRVLMLESLERAALVAERKSANSAKSHVRLKFEGNTLKLSSSSLNGQVYDELNCVKDGDDLVIGFSCRYLLDILRACDSERVILNLKAPRVCMTVCPEDKAEDKDLLYMVLPVKITE